MSLATLFHLFCFHNAFRAIWILVVLFWHLTVMVSFHLYHLYFKDFCWWHVVMDMAEIFTLYSFLRPGMTQIICTIWVPFNDISDIVRNRRKEFSKSARSVLLFFLIHISIQFVVHFEEFFPVCLIITCYIALVIFSALNFTFTLDYKSISYHGSLFSNTEIPLHFSCQTIYW